ncbi:MFS transporter [Hymenobacter wooponensis]|uniref:MFS transporter n=1 Tax=Hymenobacter wooponensis TaxID=1525360 RepID=A0A4Z0MDV4_9BACT|nr:MFS transporter [Hymenobacter wooponensis]TGD77691.1 MFS transporter [Hymenobacter wooponensis]
MKKIAYCCCFGIACMTTTYFGIVGILPQLAEHYHISLDKAGSLVSIYAVTIALVGPFATLLVSNFNRRVVLLAGFAPFLVAGVVSALGPPFWVLVLMRIVPGLFHPVFFATSLGIVGAESDPAERPRLMAIVLSGIGVATVVTIPLITYAVGQWGWPAGFGLQAIISALGMAATYWFIPSLPATAHAGFREQLGILVKPVFLLSAAMALLLVSGWFCTYGYFVNYLLSIKHVAAGSISYQLLLFGAMGLVGNWLAGKLLGRSLQVTTYLLLAGPILVAAGLLATGSQLALTTGMVAVWGLLYAPCFLLSSAVITAAAPEAVAFANSIAASFSNLGVAVGTTVGGWVIAHYGIRSLPWGNVGFALLAFAVALLLGWLQKPKPAALTPAPSA